MQKFSIKLEGPESVEKVTDDFKGTKRKIILKKQKLGFYLWVGFIWPELLTHNTVEI